MDQAMLSVVRAVEAGATTMKGVIDATGLSRLRIERALNALEKQKLLIRDGQGFRGTGSTRTAQPARQCGSCNACCDILEVAAVDKPVNQLCKHWQTGTGCTIYDSRPQMCRSFVCAWLQGHLDDDWFPGHCGELLRVEARIDVRARARGGAGDRMNFARRPRLLPMRSLGKRRRRHRSQQ